MSKRALTSYPPRNCPAKEPQGSSAGLFDWLPWMDEALRLYWECKRPGAIARAVGQELSLVSWVMKTPEWQGRSREMQSRKQALYEQHLIEMWKLTPAAIRALKSMVKEYGQLLRELEDPVARQGLKGFNAARKQAFEAAQSILDRVGLKEPERVEVESTSHHTETQETKLTYEQRLTLIREQRAAGRQPDADLLDIPLGEHDG